MKCSFCGGEIPPETSQCPGCGAPCQYMEKEQKTIQKETTVIIEKSGTEIKKVHEDFVPMGSADVSFLQEQPEEEEPADHSGCIKLGIIIGLPVITVIIVLMASC